MTFLIFISAFVALACVVLPLAVLLVFAAAGDGGADVKAPSGEPASTSSARTPKRPLPSARGETVVT